MTKNIRLLNSDLFLCSIGSGGLRELWWVVCRLLDLSLFCEAPRLRMIAQ